MLGTVQFVEEEAASSTTATDFCDIFTREMSRLHLLSFLLTGNNDKAERCFIAALHECVEENGIVTECTMPLIRRAIIKHAIQMIRPVPESGDNFAIISPAAQDSPFATIHSMGAFNRFVFVMSVLEGWSEEDCALRLRCSLRDVTIARLVTLSHSSRSENQCENVN